jgi:hypothetical protein
MSNLAQQEPCARDGAIETVDEVQTIDEAERYERPGSGITKSSMLLVPKRLRQQRERSAHAGLPHRSCLSVERLMP